jgi:ankyrin repeat protein
MLRTAREFLQKGADVQPQGGPWLHPLQAASAGGHLETIKLLLEKGAEVNTQTVDNQGKDLQDASNESHPDIVKLLLQKGADFNPPNGYYWSPLCTATLLGHIEIAKLLLEKGADVNPPGGYSNSPLCTALRHGHIRWQSYC